MQCLMRAVVAMLFAVVALGVAGAGEGPAGGRARVSGRVVDGTGAGVAGAQVTVWTGREFSRSSVSGKDGAYAFENLPAGKYHLRAEARERFTKRIPANDIEIGAGEKKKVDLALARGGVLEITVVERQTRKAVAGAEVVFNHPKSATLTTDKDGRVRLTGLGYGEASFQVKAEGYARPMPGHMLNAETEPDKTAQQTVELAREKVITGTVVDEQNRPVADAVVSVDERWESGEGMRWGSRGDWEPVITGADGAFRFGGLEEGEYQYTLSASKEGYATIHAGAGGAGMQGIKIVMRPGARIEGVVRDAGGKPVAGAMVNLGQNRSAMTDQQGRFRVIHVEAGNCAIYADKGAMSSEKITKEIGWSDRVTGLELVLQDKSKWTHTVSGRVIDGVDGKGMANVLVRFWSPAGMEAKTDALGQFVLSRVPRGNYGLLVRDAPGGYVEPPQQQNIFVQDEDVKGVVVKLTRGATISGRVLLPSGEGAWEAKLSLVHSKLGVANAMKRNAMTDAQGRFTASGLHPAMEYRVRADLKGYAPGLSEPFNLRQGDRIENIVIRLQAPGSVSGVIRDRDGKPVKENVWLNTVLPGSDSWPERGTFGRATPDANGKYQLTDLVPGKLRVQLWRTFSDGGTSVAETRIVEVGSGKDTGGVDFAAGFAAARPEKGFIAGRVVNIQSEDGLAGIEVYATGGRFSRAPGESGRAVTGADGSFRIEGLRGGNFSLRVNPGMKLGYDSQDLNVSSPSEEVPVVLRRLCAVEGRVTMAGRPVTEFTISDGGAGEKQIKDAGGKFRLEGLRRGTVVVRAEVKGVGAAQKSIELSEGQVATGITLELHKPWQIMGQVVRAKDRTPVAGASVTAETLKRMGVKAVTTGADGRFVLSRIFPGKHTLYVQHPEYGKPWFPDIELTDGVLVRDMVIELKEPARVSGRITHVSGIPFEGARLVIGQGDFGYLPEFSMEVESDYSGRFEFFPVPPGKYNVVWMVRDPELGRGGHWVKAVEVGAGGSATVDFDERGAAVGGTVTANGRPKGYACLVWRAGAVTRRIQTDLDGNYEIRGLPSGRYHVQFYMPGASDAILAERDVDVPREGKIAVDFQMPAGKKAAAEEEP